MATKTMIESLVQDVRERMSQLKAHDSAREINSHCDDLESEIEITIDSAIDHLRNIGTELLAEIRSYRKELLSYLPEPRSNSNDLSHFSDKVLATLQDLSVQIDDYEKSVALFPISEIQSVQENIFLQGNKLLDKTRQLQKVFLQETFRKRYLIFKASQIFLINRRHVGRLEYAHNVDLTKENIFTIYKLIFTYSREGRHCTHAILLRNLQVLCSFEEGGFAIYEEGKLREKKEPEISGNLNDITTTFQLPNGIVLIGNSTGILTQVVLEAGLEFDFPIEAHHSSIIDIKTLKDERVVTMSSDNTIKIWQPFLRTFKVITGHGCTKYRCQLAVLSNDYVLSCSNDTENCTLRIWDPDECKLVKEKPAGLKEVCALSVLSNDQVVIASRDGSVKLMNLDDDDWPGSVFIKPKVNNWTNFILVLPNDDIIIADSLTKPRLQIWDPHKGVMRQAIDSEHTGEITRCCMCPRKMNIVTSSIDGIIKYWTMDSNTYFIDRSIFP